MRDSRSVLERFRWSTAAEQRRCLLELVDNAIHGRSPVTVVQIQSLLYCTDVREAKDMIISDMEYGDRVAFAESVLASYPEARLWPRRGQVSLPEEIWLMVFELLGFGDAFSSVRHTCRFLFDISADSRLWKKVRSMTLPIPYCLEIRDHCVWISRASRIRSLTCQSDFLAKLSRVNPELRFRFIREIEFRDHSRVVDSDLIQCLRLCGEALKSLDLAKCESISDTGIQAIGELCPNLEHLRLDGCQLLTDASLHSLPQSLRHVSVSRCSQITDDGIYSFCSSPVSNVIEHFDINLCSRVSERGLLAIANSCPNVSTLLVAEAGITPTVITELSQKCRNLLKIDISFGIANRSSLLELMQGCPGLCHIVAVGTKGIDMALAADLRTFFDDLRLELYHDDIVPMSRALIQWRCSE